MTERPEAEFDTYAAAYDADLDAGLRLTGAGKEHYATERVRFLRARLDAVGIRRPARVLDFGCGDGDAAPILRDELGAGEVVGVDVSDAMLSRATPGATAGPTAEGSKAGRMTSAALVGAWDELMEPPPFSPGGAGGRVGAIVPTARTASMNAARV